MRHIVLEFSFPPRTDGRRKWFRILALMLLIVFLVLFAGVLLKGLVALLLLGIVAAIVVGLLALLRPELAALLATFGFLLAQLAVMIFVIVAVLVFELLVAGPVRFFRRLFGRRTYRSEVLRRGQIDTCQEFDTFEP